MRRIIALLSVMAIMAAIIAMSAFPAFAQGSACGDFVPQTAQTGELGQIASKLARSTNFGQEIVAPDCNPTVNAPEEAEAEEEEIQM